MKIYLLITFIVSFWIGFIVAGAWVFPDIDVEKYDRYMCISDKPAMSWESKKYCINNP